MSELRAKLEKRRLSMGEMKIHDGNIVVVDSTASSSYLNDTTESPIASNNINPSSLLSDGSNSGVKEMIQSSDSPRRIISKISTSTDSYSPSPRKVSSPIISPVKSTKIEVSTTSISSLTITELHTDNHHENNDKNNDDNKTMMNESILEFDNTMKSTDDSSAGLYDTLSDKTTSLSIIPSLLSLSSSPSGKSTINSKSISSSKGIEDNWDSILLEKDQFLESIEQELQLVEGYASARQSMSADSLMIENGIDHQPSTESDNNGKYSERVEKNKELSSTLDHINQHYTTATFDESIVNVDRNVNANHEDIKLSLHESESDYESMKKQVKNLKDELSKKDALILSLENQIISLKQELATASRNVKQSSVTTISFHSIDENKKEDSPMKTRKSSFQQRLKQYGFDMSDTSMASYMSEATYDSKWLDTITPLDGAQLTPMATKQLNELLSIDPGSGSGLSAQNRYSTKLSSDSTSSKSLSSSSISMLSREPSSKFLDPLRAIALQSNASNIDHDETNDTENEKSPPSRRGSDTISVGNRDSVIDPDEMSYKEFVERILQDQCSDIVQHTKRFMLSVMGPALDGKPPSRKSKVDYIFYGTKQLEKRCRDFFDDIQLQFRDHPMWKDESEERVISSRDCLETYVMARLYPIAFASVEAKVEDEALLKRMKLLSFIRPENLDMRPELREETQWQLAINELKKIDQRLSPGDKIDAVVKCTTMIFKSIEAAGKKLKEVERNKDHPLNLSNQSNQSSNEIEEESPLGADDFLPVFIFVVLRSQIERLYSTCYYIQAFLNPIRLMSKKGYCLVNLQSALEFLMHVDADTLSMDRDEFNQKLAIAEASLKG